MKTNRIYLALAAFALVISCTTVIEQESVMPEKATQELTITATTEMGIDTKTELSQTDGSVLWTPGDAISLFYGSGTNGGSCFTSTATEKTAVTNFTGTIGVITGGAEISAEDTYFWGVYPYSPTASCDGSSVTMSLSATQTAMAGSFAPGTSPSLGRSQGLSMGFYNICGGVKFTVTHEGIKKVTLRSNGGEQIAGTAKVIFDDSGLPKVQEILSGTDEITLEAPEGQYFEVGQYYYIMMFPTKFNSGFTLTLETFTEETTIEKNNVINITRSYFGRMLNVDGNATYTQKTGNIPIPDANFKAYMVENFDTDSDGEISYEEALLITSIRVNTDDIASVRGIEYCLNLGILDCRGTRDYDNTLHQYVNHGLLTSLDVSNNTALTTLWCESNQLTSLDVLNNTALTGLSCDSNQLTSLDVSNNTALTELYCYSNQLTSLDVSNNTALTWLYCDFNQLPSLDVSNNSALYDLRCISNQLTSLDVSNNTALWYLDCWANQLTSLDLSNNTALQYLYCNSNQLSSLDVSSNTALTYLHCGSNQLSSLDVSNNTALTQLTCSFNQLSSLDVSNNIALTCLECASNQLTSLDVSNNTALETLHCQNNPNLTEIWLMTGQTITTLNYDTEIAAVKYKEVEQAWVFTSVISNNGGDSFAYDYLALNEYEAVKSVGNTYYYDDYSSSYRFSGGETISFGIVQTGGNNTYACIVPTLTSLDYLTELTSAQISTYSWQLQKKDGDGEPGSSAGWSPVFSGLNMKSEGVLEVTCSITHPELLSTDSNAPSYIQLKASATGDNQLFSDWLKLIPRRQEIHLALSSTESFSTGNAYDCGLVAPNSVVVKKDLYAEASEAVTHAPSVPVIYNGGPVDLSSMVSVHALESGEGLTCYSPNEFVVLFSDFRFEYELVPYYVGSNAYSESFYGLIDGTRFTPCYIGGSTPSILPIQQGSSSGISAVGHKPLVLVTLVSGFGDNKKTHGYGYFTIEITQ